VSSGVSTAIVAIQFRTMSMRVPAAVPCSHTSLALPVV
jgi:hypothetical protein